MMVFLPPDLKALMTSLIIRQDFLQLLIKETFLSEMETVYLFILVMFILYGCNSGALFKEGEERLENFCCCCCCFIFYM